MRVLVTGGRGFLGGRLAQFLAAAGHVVSIASRQPATPVAWLPGALVIQLDWTSDDALDRMCASTDAVVHAAGMDAQACAADPIGALAFNGVGTGRLVDAAVRQGVRRFLYASSYHVYGSPLSGTITEDTCPASLHPYGTSRRAAEDCVRAAKARGAIEGIVVRLSNGYGAPAHVDAPCWMLLANDLCRQAVTVGSMTLTSSGLQCRDFVPMTDVCRGIEHLLSLPADALVGGLFNIGRGQAPTVWEQACLIQSRAEAVLGFRPELRRTSSRPDETYPQLHYKSDALQRTGLTPRDSTIEEIDRLLAFCQAAFATR